MGKPEDELVAWLAMGKGLKSGETGGLQCKGFIYPGIKIEDDETVAYVYIHFHTEVTITEIIQYNDILTQGCCYLLSSLRLLSLDHEA
jgi:hypothetical protein